MQCEHGGIFFRLPCDLGIDGFIYDRMVQGFRVTQWYIWDPGIMYIDCFSGLIKRVLVQALLEDREFLVGRIVMSQIQLIF